MNGYCIKEQDITITHGLTTPLPCFEPDAKKEKEQEKIEKKEEEEENI